MDNIIRFNNFIKILNNKIKVNISYKNESSFMKILSYILFFNKGFLTDYTTTIGHTIYFSSREHVEADPMGAMCIAAHEYRHIRDSGRMGSILYALAYLFPQILALLAAPAAFLVGWWALLLLLFLAPLPAFWRARIELAGYTMTLFINHLYGREIGMDSERLHTKLYNYADYMDEVEFRGGRYYFMWPFGVKDKLEKAIETILSGDILKSDDIYVEVKDAFEKSQI